MRNFLNLIVFFTIGFSSIGTAGTFLNPSKNDIIDQTQNTSITTDLYPNTSKYMHDLNMKLIYALKNFNIGQSSHIMKYSLKNSILTHNVLSYII